MTRIKANVPALITLASIAVLGIALVSQYFGGLTPCKLCHYQRWPYIFTIATINDIIAIFAIQLIKIIGTI